VIFIVLCAVHGGKTYFLDVINQFILRAMEVRKSQQRYGPIDFSNFSLSLCCPAPALATVRFPLQRIPPSSVNKTHKSEKPDMLYHIGLDHHAERNLLESDSET
jgi:hypothetical protein